MTDIDSRPVRELFDLSGTVSLVTGATGQLGRHIAEALAEQGSHVVVLARTESACVDLAENLSSKYQKSIAAPADVTDPDAVRAVLETIDETFGRLDVLVNNAYNGETTAFEDLTVAEFQDTLEIGLTSSFLCMRKALPLLRDGGGSIINISSIYGVVAPDHNIYGDTGLNNPIHYGAAKAGLLQVTRWVAARYGSEEIRANAIVPGGFYNDELSSIDGYEGVFVENYENRTPLGRMGRPEDLKGPVAFLASDASSWMTGAELTVDGGWTAW